MNAISWISVKEALPEKSGKYMVVTCAGWVTTLGYSAVHKAFNVNDYEEVPDTAIDVAYWAWMPWIPDIDDEEAEV